MLLAAVVGSLSVPLLSTSVWAQEDREGKDAFVVLTGRLEVTEAQSVDDAVIFDGPAVVDGTVTGTLVSFNGPVTISGSVEEDVVVFNDAVTVRSGARIGGDLITRRPPHIEEGATVAGEVRQNPFDLFRDPFPFLARFLAWLAFSVSLLALGLLLLAFAPRAPDTLVQVWRTGVGASIGWGLLLFFGLPVVAALSLVTLVGIPFGLGLFAALGPLYALGYVAAASIVGRLLVKQPRSPVVAFIAGLAVLRVLALIPVVAGIVAFIASAFGLGALAVAVWRSRRRAVEPA